MIPTRMSLPPPSLGHALRSSQLTVAATSRLRSFLSTLPQRREWREGSVLRVPSSCYTPQVTRCF